MVKDQRALAIVPRSCRYNMYVDTHSRHETGRCANAAMGAHKLQRRSLRFMRHQAWEDAVFVHWAVDARALQALLPRALEPDRFDGLAYVGLVLLAENGISARLPVISAVKFSHLAANVRTYVRLKSRPELTGIYFFSLDCSSALVTLGARAAFSLPYQLSTMAHSVTVVPCGDGDGADARSGLTQHKFNAVRCRSRWCRRPGTSTSGPNASTMTCSISARWTCAPGRSVDSAPGTFAHYAVERYHLFVEGKGLGTAGLGYAVGRLVGATMGL